MYLGLDVSQLLKEILEKFRWFLKEWEYSKGSPICCLGHVCLNSLMCSKMLFGCWVVSDSLWLHGLQHTRLLCPPPSPRVYLNSWPLNRWCCLAISSSAALFSFCLQSFPASGSFPVSWLFTSGGWGIKASASVLPMNNQGWFPLGFTGLISLHFKSSFILMLLKAQFRKEKIDK